MKFLMSLFLSLVLGDWSPAPTSPQQGDICHVYVVKAEVAEKLFKQVLKDPKNPELKSVLAKVETRFPDFETKFGEEELTTKTYPFPGQARTITASVFYTDESNIGDSMTLAVVVSDKGLDSAINAEDSAVTEVSLNDGTDVVRTKQVIRINKVLYLVGLECKCQRKSDTKAKP